uniref:natural cytotoxicity triggering receptor 2 n=1 Tax=Odobenus rosmarus divergens TaxID=9708 RepID=UPI00063C9C0C|nr:PREDICTED: natural cytotoxicity triggering receptor 2 [Odobenus rosmarus divergens]
MTMGTCSSRHSRGQKSAAGTNGLPCPLLAGARHYRAAICSDVRSSRVPTQGASAPPAVIHLTQPRDPPGRCTGKPRLMRACVPMSPATSLQGKGRRVWRTLLLLLLLLPLLIPGSWALPEAHHLHRVAGQTLSVTCQYPPKGWPYERKGWCKELSAFKCTRLVTSSSPGRLVQASRFSIWDNPSTGVFTVTMTGLKEEDSGHYWCRIYHVSSNSVSKSIRFYLAVSPARASTQAIQASVSSEWDLLGPSPRRPWLRGPQVSLPPNTLLSPSCPLSSRQQNSTLQSHPAAPSALVPMLCALLVAKSLVLSALLVRALRSPRVQHRGMCLTCPARPRLQALGSKKDGHSPPGPRGAPAWPLNPSLTAKKRQKSPRT